MPVDDRIPEGVASPNAWVAWSRSPSVVPPPTVAFRAPGSTCVQRMGERSTVTPSSTRHRPAPLWPPPRTASVRPASRTKPIAAITSAASAHHTTAAGRRSIMALWTVRARRYSGSCGPTTGPRSALRIASRASSVVPFMAGPSPRTPRWGPHPARPPRRAVGASGYAVTPAPGEPRVETVTVADVSSLPAVLAPCQFAGPRGGRHTRRGAGGAGVRRGASPSHAGTPRP